MFCPYCRQPVSPQGEKCPSCGMDAEGVRRWLGPPPAIHAGFNDLTGELPSRHGRKFYAAAMELRDRHPQCEFHWVHVRLDPDVPPALYAFHCFNHGRVCAPGRSGGANRDALLVTDAASVSAALVVGYGLEPFLLPGEIESTLAAGQALLAAGQTGAAAAAIARAWRLRLDQMLDRLPRAYGLPAPGEMTVGLDESVRAAALRRPSEY